MRSDHRKRLPMLLALAISLVASLLVALPAQAKGSSTEGAPRGYQPPGGNCQIAPLPPFGARIPFDGVCDYLLDQRDPAVATQAAIYDNVSGQSYSLTTGDDPQYTASIAKVDILAEWLNGYQQQGVAIPDGIDYSIQYLMQNMIENSNNQAATSLFYFGGGCQALTAFNRLIPLNDTEVGCETSDYYGWGNTITTAADQVALMKVYAYGANQYVPPEARRRAIQNCKRKIRNPKKRKACIERVNRKFDRLARTPILNQAARSYGLGLMENIESDQSWGLTCGPWGDACDPPNYAPPDPGVTVAHKNGWKTLPDCGPPIDPCPWQVNSTGWVNGKDRDYVLSILTTNNPAGPQLTDGFNYGIDTIQEISRIVWSNLGQAP